MWQEDTDRQNHNYSDSVEMSGNDFFILFPPILNGSFPFPLPGLALFSFPFPLVIPIPSHSYSHITTANTNKYVPTKRKKIWQ